MAHPRHKLDDAFLTPVRLSLMAALPKEVELDFASLRTIIEVEDSVLSKGIAHLEKLGWPVTLKPYPEVGHAIPPVVRRELYLQLQRGLEASP